MHGHGTTGRTFRGRVLQLVTGSTGLDDYEVGRDALRTYVGRREGLRLPDAFRRGVSPLCRVRPILRSANSLRLGISSTPCGSTDEPGRPNSDARGAPTQRRTRVFARSSPTTRDSWSRSPAGRIPRCSRGLRRGARCRPGALRYGSIGVARRGRPCRDRSARRRMGSALYVAVATGELDNPAYQANGLDRCYYCKAELMGALTSIAREEHAEIALGVNVDDLGDYRPGQAAAREAGAVFPAPAGGTHQGRGAVVVSCTWTSYLGQAGERLSELAYPPGHAGHDRVAVDDRPGRGAHYRALGLPGTAGPPLRRHPAASS